MAAEGDSLNPVGGGGGGDNYPQEAAAAAAEEAAQAAVAQGAGHEPAEELANREGAGAGDDDVACRDLVLIEDPEAVAVEDPEEAKAAAALQEEMKALIASIPDGAGALFTAMQLQELEQQSRTGFCSDGFSYSLFGLRKRPRTGTREVPTN